MTVRNGPSGRSGVHETEFPTVSTIKKNEEAPISCTCVAVESRIRPGHVQILDFNRIPDLHIRVTEQVKTVEAHSS